MPKNDHPEFEKDYINIGTVGDRVMTSGGVLLVAEPAYTLALIRTSKGLMADVLLELERAKEFLPTPQYVVLLTEVDFFAAIASYLPAESALVPVFDPSPNPTGALRSWDEVGKIQLGINAGPKHPALTPTEFGPAATTPELAKNIRRDDHFTTWRDDSNGAKIVYRAVTDYDACWGVLRYQPMSPGAKWSVGAEPILPVPPNLLLSRVSEPKKLMKRSG